MNEELLKQAVKAIEARPENWDQESWAENAETREVEDQFYSNLGRDAEWRIGVLSNIIIEPNGCGTKMCLAGHVVANAGYTINGAATVVDGPYAGQQVSQVAKQLLDIDKHTAYIVFGGAFGDTFDPVTDEFTDATVDSFKAALTKETGVTFE